MRVKSLYLIFETLFSRGVNKTTKRVCFRVMYYCNYNVQCIFNDSSLVRKFEETKVHFFEISKARKVHYFEISKRVRSKEKFVTSQFRKNLHHFTAFSSKYRIERRQIPREISPTYRRKFARTIDEIRRNSLSLLLHSTVFKIMKTLSRSVASCQAIENNNDLLRKEETIGSEYKFSPKNCPRLVHKSYTNSRPDSPRTLRKITNVCFLSL